MFNGIYRHKRLFLYGKKYDSIGLVFANSVYDDSAIKLGIFSGYLRKNLL